MTGKPEIRWGRGVIQTDCVHVRESRAGNPVVHDVDGERVGFAVCGTWLIADAPDPSMTAGVHACSHCVALLDERAEPRP